MKDDLIRQFVEQKSLDAMNVFLTTDDAAQVVQSGVELATAFGGSGEPFRVIADASTNGEARLISSFHNNLELLIQKTWVEKFDEELKAEVLYELGELSTELSSRSYADSYKSFFTIVDNVVYLMFGTQAKAKDFDEYALRIDPEFGIFWWYIQDLPRDADWAESKIRIAVLLGMYFLANY